MTPIGPGSTRPRRRLSRTLLLIPLVLVLVVAGVVALIVVDRRGGDQDSCGGTVTGATTTGPSTAAALPFVSRSGNQLEVDGQPWRFSGVNEFWLGLDGDQHDEAGPEYPSHAAIRQGISGAASLCARVIRSISLGVSVGNKRSIEPELGQFNDKAFDTIDYAVAVARCYGIRLVVPFTDSYHYYTGGQHTFTNWIGYTDLPGKTQSNDGGQRHRERQFFTDSRVIDAFRAYVRHYLDHVNAYTGVRLGSDPTIAVWEQGNELKSPPTTWVESTARFIKQLSPHTLVGFSGSVDGDFTEAARQQPSIDVYDGHFYPRSLRGATTQAAAVHDVDRAYFVGEYPLFGADLGIWFDRLASDRSVSGDLAWSLLPTVDGRPEQHDDGYTFHYPPANSRERVGVPLLRAHSKMMITSR